eukprot:g6043.t1
MGSIRVTCDDSVGYVGGVGGAGVRNTTTTQVSLEGARYAVAWSGINAFNGCGFDLVWASGRAWSLLCDDPLSRKLWVDALNLSIRSAENGTGGIDTDVNIDAGKRQSSPLSREALDRGQQPRPQRPPRGGDDDAGRREGWRDADSAAASDRRHLGAALPPARTSPRLGENSRPWDSNPAGEGTGDLLRDGHHRYGPFGREGDHAPRAETSGIGTRLVVAGERRRSPGGLPHEEPTPREEVFAVGVVASSDAEQPRHEHRHRRQHPPLGPGPGRRRQREEREPTHDGTFGVATDKPGRCSSDAAQPGFGALLSPADLASSQVDGDGGGGEGSTDSSGVFGGAQRSRASHRSEELARESAATWEQFQQLLERSRKSKDRFDKAMEGAAPAPAAETAAHGQAEVRGKGGEGLTARLSQSGGSDRFGLRPAAKDGTAASGTVGALALRRDAMAVSTGGSSTDRVSSATTPRSRAETESGEARRTAKDSDFDAVHPDAGGDVDEHEDSRLSAGVTDVETSLLPEDDHAHGRTRGQMSFDQGHRLVTQCSSSSSSSGSSSSCCSGGSSGGSAGDGICGDKRAEEGSRRRRRRRQSCVLPPPPPSKATAASPAHRHHLDVVLDARASEDAAGIASLSRRVQQLEADLDAARVQAEAAAQAEVSLRRQLAAATAGRDDDKAESRRLKDELLDVKAALAGQHVREREAARARTLLEQEGVKQRTAAAEAHSRGEARVVEALAEAARAEREKAEYARQKQELEQALAAETGERRRLSSLLDDRSRSESASREKARVGATAVEGDLKARLASARSELEAVSLERDALAEELDQCITRLGDQAREVASALRSRQQREIAEISSRCEVEKEALREKVVLELEERARNDVKAALAAQERRIRGEAAAKASKDAKQRDKQLREARAEAEAAGEATRKDIEKLRGLHARRVQRLEALVKEEGDNLADARREIAACKATLAGDAGDFQRWTEEQRDQSTRLLKELAVIQRKVDKAVSAESEAREREGLAMGRLRKVMEEARLERAEGAEVKRQLREALAELESDRSSRARQARNNLQLKRAAEIAQQEVAMVEADRARWQQERLSMEAALERLTRLVYGTANRSSANGSSSSSSGRNDKSSNNRANPTAAPTGGAGKHAPAYPWRPPGGAGVVATGGRGHAGGGGSGGGDARAVCSPIGVNVM